MLLQYVEKWGNLGRFRGLINLHCVPPNSEYYIRYERCSVAWSVSKPLIFITKCCFNKISVSCLDCNQVVDNIEMVTLNLSWGWRRQGQVSARRGRHCNCFKGNWNDRSNISGPGILSTSRMAPLGNCPSSVFKTVYCALRYLIILFVSLCRSPGWLISGERVLVSESSSPRSALEECGPGCVRRCVGWEGVSCLTVTVHWDWDSSCHQSVTDPHTDNTTSCVSPDHKTRSTAKTRTGSWRKYLTATIPAQSNSTCSLTSFLLTQSSKSEISTVSGKISYIAFFANYSSPVTSILSFSPNTDHHFSCLASTRRTFWWRRSTTSSASPVSFSTNWGGATSTTTSTTAEQRKFYNYLNLLLYLIWWV